jgi:hypothetical protein
VRDGLSLEREGESLDGNLREPLDLFMRVFEARRAAMQLAALLAGRGANWTGVVDSAARERMEG